MLPSGVSIDIFLFKIKFVKKGGSKYKRSNVPLYHEAISSLIAVKLSI